MPFWHGPQTHQEAPGSSIAIQHEIKRQSLRTRQDELCTGTIRGAHVPGAVLHHLLVCTHHPALRGLPPWNPAPVSRPQVSTSLFCQHSGQWKMLCHIFNPIKHSIPDPGAPWERPSLVMFQSRKCNTQTGKKRREMPSYEYALT